MQEPVIINNENDIVEKTFDEGTLRLLMNESIAEEIINDGWYEFNPSKLTFGVTDVGSGKTVTVNVTNRFGETSSCTLYFEVEG